MKGFRRIACAWLANAFRSLADASMFLPRSCDRIADWFEERAE